MYTGNRWKQIFIDAQLLNIDRKRAVSGSYVHIRLTFAHSLQEYLQEVSNLMCYLHLNYCTVYKSTRSL